VLNSFLQAFILINAVLVGLVLQANPQAVSADRAPATPTRILRPSSPSSPSAPSQVYLPLIFKGIGPPPPWLLIGVYSIGAYFDNQTAVDQHLLGLDSWAGLSRTAGKGHSISGDFMDFMPPYNNEYNITRTLETLWSNGYTKFINLSANKTAAQIATGCCDDDLRTWAQHYKTWFSLGGNRRAFIAPLQEMNGNWIPYGYDPPNFKLAYERIKNIFEAEGVTRDKVWWVFAPNGWSTPPYGIQDYYPGDALVDIVAFSSYNQSCVQPWMTPQTVFGPYIAEIRQVTASKPIFIAQTGTGSTGGDKDQWLRDAYSYLGEQRIRGIIYFNGSPSGQCDWIVYNPSGSPKVQGYKDAVNTTGILYLPPATLATTTIQP
jgi:hypothetical protein